ncbi:TPA: transposase [Burkholderia multivorans]|nr:transposase [Burkholderia multivorans]
MAPAHQWAYANGITMRLGRSGKPTQNAYVESFNGKVPDECLNGRWFTTLARACALIATLRHCRNWRRQHSAQNYPLPIGLCGETPGNSTGCCCISGVALRDFAKHPLPFWRGGLP